MVSAAKLRRAQQAIQEMRPYANKLNEMLRNILSNVEDEVSIEFANEREVKKACLVVITSNRGLCGAFNSNVIKKAMAAINEKYADVRANGNLTLLFIGKRGLDYMKKRYPDCEIIDEYVELFNDLTFDQTSAISERLM